MSEMVRYQAERVDLADALHDAECECGDRPDHEATDGVDYSNTASTVVGAGWMPAARCAGIDSAEAVSDRLFLRQIAGVVDVRTRGEQWQHEVLHRVGELARVSSPPADLPASLASVDDVAAVCEAYELEKTARDRHAWTVTARAWVRTQRVGWELRDGDRLVSGDWGTPTVVLTSAIQAARSAS